MPLVDLGHWLQPITQRGPTSEIGALFGFVGVPAKARINQGGALKEAALEQLVQLFGPQAQKKP